MIQGTEFMVNIFSSRGARVLIFNSDVFLFRTFFPCFVSSGQGGKNPKKCPSRKTFMPISQLQSKEIACEKNICTRHERDLARP